LADPARHQVHQDVRVAHFGQGLSTQFCVHSILNSLFLNLGR
jgi:hypothetical protein